MVDCIAVGAAFCMRRPSHFVTFGLLAAVALVVLSARAFKKTMV